MAASPQPITNVTVITLLMSMPMSELVSKSRETARIAIPILVCLISMTSRNTSTMVRTGVMSVTIFVVADPIFTVF